MHTLKVHAVEARPGIGILRIEGAVDASNVSRVKTTLDEFFRQKIYRIVVNLARAQYIASSGFSLFISASDTADQSGGRVIFAAPSLDVREIFDLLGLRTLLRFAGDEASGLKALDGP